MIQGIVKKLIFTFYLFIYFIQPSRSADLKNIDNEVSKLNWTKILNSKNSFACNNFLLNDFHEISDDKKLLNQYTNPLIANSTENRSEIVIQSDQQSEVNNVVNAEGNVLVKYLGKILKADNLIYDKSIKKIEAQGISYW